MVFARDGNPQALVVRPNKLEDLDGGSKRIYGEAIL
jgi:hypothetical protein